MLRLLKIALSVLLMTTICQFARAQNSYLPIDTACIDCRITKKYTDATLNYEFASDSTLKVIRVSYHNLKKYQFRYTKNLRIEDNSVYGCDIDILEIKPRIIKRKAICNYKGKEATKVYNSARKYREVTKSLMD